MHIYNKIVETEYYQRKKNRKQLEKKKKNRRKEEEKSLQHPVFPGGHPSKY